MARDYAHVNVDIWNDEDFRALPALAQHLYFTLWTNVGLSYCGVMDWRPGRLAPLSCDLSRDDIRLLADCLEARLFIVTDDNSEEVLIRSWVRWDGLLKQPKLAVSYINAFGNVASNDLRGVIVHEAMKLRERQPDLVGWNNERVQNMLELTAIEPRDRALPKDPFGDGPGPSLGVGLPQGLGEGLAQTLPTVSTRVSPPPTPTPTPISKLYSDSLRSSADLTASEAEPTAQTLIAEWIDHCGDRPPGKVIGQVSKELKAMLEEGIRYRDVRHGLALWQQKGLHPSALASVVHESRSRNGKAVRAIGVQSPGDEWMRRRPGDEWKPADA